MNLLVCVKQVPDSETPIEIDASAPWVMTGRGTEFRTNRYDEYAVEEAVRLKENFGGSSIDVLSVGPARSDAVIRRAIGMGADNGIHVMTPEDGFCDPFTIASWIAAVARGRAYDLILTGILSEDMMQGQVGPMVAELLSLPCATAVVGLTLSPDGHAIEVEREIEGGCRDLAALELPALITVQSGINRPRYPSLSNLLRANRLSIQTLEAVTLDAPGGRQIVKQVRLPRQTRAGMVLTGTPEEKADRLLQILHERSWLS